MLDHQGRLDLGGLATVRRGAVEGHACRHLGIRHGQSVHHTAAVAEFHRADLAIGAIERLQILEAREEIIQQRVLIATALHLAALVVIAGIAAQ